MESKRFNVEMMYSQHTPTKILHYQMIKNLWKCKVCIYSKVGSRQYNQADHDDDWLIYIRVISTTRASAERLDNLESDVILKIKML